MVNRQRRRILQLGAVGMLSACAPVGLEKKVSVKKRKLHVAIIGGGYGGATAARYLKQLDPEINVTLVEYNKIYATAPGSNQVLVGVQKFPSILVKYRKLERLGIKVIHDWVSAIDTDGRNLRFDDGSRLGYDHLIVASGIGFNWKAIDGYNAEVAETIPHAWQAGVQTLVLAKQLKTMRSGGVFILSRPQGEMRCPQAVYERVSLAAEFLQKNNRRAKIILFDPQEKDLLRDRFAEDWASNYGFGTDQGMIELVSGRDARLQKLDASALAIFTGAIEQRFKADVLNIIPPQEAGEIAQAAGLADKNGWCPVNPLTAESTLVPGIHVIGDAAALYPIDKLASVANISAKLCARAIAGSSPLQQLPIAQTCYLRLKTGEAFSTVRLFSLHEKSIEPVTSSNSESVPSIASKEQAGYADSWWKNIKADSWG